MRFMNNSNKKYTQISIYVIITAMVIYCLSLVVKNIPSIISDIFDKLSWVIKVIKPVILGFVLSYLLAPVVDFLEIKLKKIKILKKKQNSCRSYAVLIAILGLLFLFAAIISLLVFSVTNQLRVANLDDIVVICNNYMAIFSDFYNNVMGKIKDLDIQSAELSQYIQKVGTYALTAIQEFAANAVGSITNISGYLTTFVFGLIISIYFLIDGKMMKGYIGKIFRAFFSEKVNKRMQNFITDADMVFSGYIRGQLTDAFIMMILISITLSVINVKFAVVIGVLAGVGNLIPYCGPIVAYIGTIIVCLLNGQYKQLIIGIILLFIIQTIDGNVIGPRLLSKSINIHPLLVMISLIFGSAIGGFMGMLLAVPVGALLKVLFVDYIEYRIKVKESAKAEMPKMEKKKV